MTALTPDTIRAATDTLSRLAEHLRGNPDLDEALALVEPLLDEYTGVPVQLADTLRALARTVQEHPNIRRTTEVALLSTELRTAAWEQADQHALHYVVDDLRALSEKAPATEQRCIWCR